MLRCLPSTTICPEAYAHPGQGSRHVHPLSIIGKISSKLMLNDMWVSSEPGVVERGMHGSEGGRQQARIRG